MNTSVFMCVIEFLCIYINPSFIKYTIIQVSIIRLKSLSTLNGTPVLQYNVLLNSTTSTLLVVQVPGTVYILSVMLGDGYY